MVDEVHMKIIGKHLISDATQKIANLEVEILELKEEIKKKRKELETLTEDYRLVKNKLDEGQKTLDEVDDNGL